MKKLEETEVEVQKVEASGSVGASSPAVSTDSKPTINGSVGELPKRIIVPLDGSDFSFRAAQYAINLARLTGGEILCIHAIADLPYIEYMAPAGGLTVPRYIQEAKKQTDEWFSQVRSRAAKEGVKITAETIFSPPSVAESIINYASEQKADLIDRNKRQVRIKTIGARKRRKRCSCTCKLPRACGKIDIVKY